jgi:DNA replication protein DnaC
MYGVHHPLLNDPVHRLYYCMPCLEEVKKKNRTLSKATINLDDKIQAAFGARFREASFESFVSDLPALKKMAEYHPGYTKANIAAIHSAYHSAKMFADEFVETGAGTLILTGPPGCGKTTLEAAVVREALRADKNVAVRKAVNFVRDIRATYRGGIGASQRTMDQMVQSLHNADLVVIEDLHPSCFRDDIRNLLFEVVDRIYTENRGFIMSSNVPLTEMRKGDKLGAHMVDRLIEPPSCIVELPPTTPSWRMALKRRDEHLSKD